MTAPKDQESNRQPYPVPRHTTPEGTEAFHEYVHEKARALAAELNYSADRDSKGGLVPQKAEFVRKQPATSTAETMDHGRRTLEPGLPTLC